MGNTTYEALTKGHGLSDIRDNGNGSLMRILPLAYTNASDDVIAEVSAITHAHALSTRACITYVHIARDIIQGMPARDAVNAHADEFQEARLHDIWELAEPSIRSTGYVVDTLEAALWGITTTQSYHDCVLRLIALGGDTDTIAAVAGGVYAVISTSCGIPAAWFSSLRGKHVIDACLDSR